MSALTVRLTPLEADLIGEALDVYAMQNDDERHFTGSGRLTPVKSAALSRAMSKLNRARAGRSTP